ncbi:HTH domain-containing protein [Cryobacterium sp. TMT2-15-1]|uniref:helix-turn-helix transcriptional regulator n=1 Tax=Cryobacterium sp. TMT2-15-1 TaxID=1259246 RepID=UPI00106C5BC8|nr:HTH domain-containing protein [Cryobacterium sp. TMT2-15-1]TFC54090.1 HTH domain-containing protein [Cryobacterium sp. TMT2-15-1]
MRRSVVEVICTTVRREADTQRTGTVKIVAFSKSTDPHLTLRRIERQHALIEELRRYRGSPRSGVALASALGVTSRTIERDITRMRQSGIPIRVQRGPHGGYAFEARSSTAPVVLDPGEIAALIVALVALGPTATESARTSMIKLINALRP